MGKPTEDFLSISLTTDRHNVGCLSMPLSPYSQNGEAAVCSGKLEWHGLKSRSKGLTTHSQDDLFYILWHFWMVASPHSCLTTHCPGFLYIGWT